MHLLTRWGRVRSLPEANAPENLDARRRLRRARPGPPRTAFVFSGGASLGALQAGMLAALFERRITADLLVGTSAGAVNAAFIASRPQTTATAQELGSVWRSLRREDIFPVNLRAVVGGLRSKRDHLVSDRGLRQLVRRHVQLDLLENAAVPLHVVCFDLTAGREVLLSSGSAQDAVVASSSIPGILPPVKLGNRRLIDGGIANGTPVSHAIALGAKRIYVLPTCEPSGVSSHDQAGAVDSALQALRLVVQFRLGTDIDRHADKAELIVLPAPNPDQIPPGDFAHAAELIDGALLASRRFLARDDADPVVGMEAAG